MPLLSRRDCSSRSATVSLSLTAEGFVRVSVEVELHVGALFGHVLVSPDAHEGALGVVCTAGAAATLRCKIRVIFPE